MKKHLFLFTTILGAGLAFSISAQAAMDNRDVVHSTNGQIVRNSFGHCVRTQWMSPSDECHPMQAMQVRKPIGEEERTVYFDFNKAEIMESERQKLDSLANVLQSRDEIDSVSIVGYADRIGTPSYNERLSKKRAEAVETYLRKRGYLNTSVADTRWVGESDPVTHCPNNLSHADLIACLQKDRRVTVDIQYKEDKTATNPKQ